MPAIPRVRHVVVVLALAAASWAAVTAQETAAVYQGSAAEEFLARARIREVRDLGTGVTRPKRVRLERDGVSRFAIFKSIDVSKQGVTQFGDGTVELDFQDSWQTEVAAYHIDLLLGLGLVPATVERRINNDVGSLQWWVESMMTEAERQAKGLEPPDAEAWNRQTYKARMFDQLIANVDRHMKNLLVTKDFELRLIDHSRAFRTTRELKDPDALKRFSRSLLDSMASLTADGIKKRAGRYLSSGQIERLLQRRDAILALAKARVAELGEAAVIFP